MSNFFIKIFNAVFGHEITGDIKKFISLNQKHWKDIKGNASEGYILVDGMKISAAYFVVAARSAKSIEEATGCLPIVLLDTYGFLAEFWKKIYGSYNINNFIYLKNYFIKIIFAAKSLFLSFNFYRRKRTAEDLLKLSFRGIYIGDLIYDNILRFNADIYTVDKIKLKYFSYFFLAYFRALIYDDIFDKYDIRYVYGCLPVFISGGILIRTADKRGAIVILASRKLMKNYKGLNIREGKYRPRKEDVEALKNKKELFGDIEKYLEKRFSGNVNELDAIKSFKDKKEYDREFLCQSLNFDPSKPIVFIMAHAFSDGPHHTPAEKLLFPDFYIWLRETIKYISQSDDINWIVKSHPMSFKYKEEGEVEKLVKIYGKGNVRTAPQDLSTKSIKELAHALVTVLGKSALEFGCFGIPSVIASYAPYGGFGFTIEPKSREEYFIQLKNIKNVSRLSADQIKTAKVLSAILFLYSRTNDPLFPPKENVLYLRYNEVARWKQNCQMMENYDRHRDEFFLRIKDLLNLNLYKKYLG